MRWWRRRRGWAAALARLAVLGAAATGAFEWLRRGQYICTMSDAEAQIERLCSNYDQGRSGGNLCAPLCDSPRELEATRCQAYHFQKPVAFTAGNASGGGSGGTELVFKSFGEDAPLGRQCPDGRDMAVRAARRIRASLGLEMEPAAALAAVWDFGHGGLGAAALAATAAGERCPEKVSLMAVYRSREFLTFAVLGAATGAFPAAAGLCGEAFASERLSEMPPPASASWRARLELSLLVLELLERLEAGVGGRPVVVCDVKLEHFALDRDGRLRIIDGDNVYLQPKGDDHMGRYDRKCRTDGDCDVLDCRGICNVTHNSCQKVVTNNNLQMFCEKVFLGSHKESYRPASVGLLSGAPSRALRDLVAECANPGSSPGRARAAADPALGRMIRAAAEELLEELKKS